MTQVELKKIVDGAQRLYDSGGAVPGAEVSPTYRLSISGDYDQQDLLMQPILLEPPTLEKFIIPGLSELDGAATYTFDGYIFYLLFQDDRGAYHAKEAIGQADFTVLYQKYETRTLEVIGNSARRMQLKEVVPLMYPSLENGQPIQQYFELLIGGDISNAIQTVKNTPGDTTLLQVRLAMIRHYGAQTQRFLDAIKNQDTATANNIPIIGLVNIVGDNAVR